MKKIIATLLISLLLAGPALADRPCPCPEKPKSYHREGHDRAYAASRPRLVDRKYVVPCPSAAAYKETQPSFLCRHGWWVGGIVGGVIGYAIASSRDDDGDHGHRGHHK